MTILSGQTDTTSDLITSVIQNTYGDATQTVLDREAARNILKALRASGWASLDEVAVLIESAGGSITVPDQLMADGKERRVMVQDDYAHQGRRFTVSVDSPRPA